MNNSQRTVSMTELARRLGVQVHQVHYLAKTGRIPLGEKADKFRLYTEEQVQRIQSWYEAYLELDRGVKA
jgi:DNA-binding transcriptional MerR regulator